MMTSMTTFNRNSSNLDSTWTERNGAYIVAALVIGFAVYAGLTQWLSLVRPVSEALR